MSARIQAEFLRIDKALRSGCNLRSSLKADSLQAWEACANSLDAALSFFGDGACIFTSASDKSAAVWVQWRKSNTSKQLFGLLRSALEAVAAEARRRDASASASRCMESMAVGLHAGITIVDFLHVTTTNGALWPALREWLMEQGGIDTMWRALTWDLEGACAGGVGGSGTSASRILISVGLVLSLSLRSPKPLPQPNDALLKGHGGDGGTVLQLTLGKLLPAAFPAMQPDARAKAIAFARRIGLLCCGSPARGLEYLEPMHLPALRAWPYLVGAARHQISQISVALHDSKEREGMQVREYGGRAWRIWEMQLRGPGA